MATKVQYSDLTFAYGGQVKNLRAAANNGEAVRYEEFLLSSTNDRNRANHTGTQTASTISDFTTAVRLNRLNEMAAPNAAVAMNSQKITGLANGAAGSQDAAAMTQLESASTNDRNRANHTGTQVASTISNFDTQVRTSRLDQMAAPTATVGMNGQVLAGLGNPSASTDAVNKQYVDALPRTYIINVAVSTNTSVASPGASLDLQAMTVGDRVLLAGQTTASQNGLYVWNGAAVAMTRAPEWDTSGEMHVGDTFMPISGFSWNGSSWRFLGPASPAVGTTSLLFRVTSDNNTTLNRAFHLGTQLASTISDFDTAVRISRLDQMTAPLANVSMNGYRITNLQAPNQSTDAANRQYVDDKFANVAGGLTSKGSVRAYVKTNVNINSAPATLDGVTPSTNDSANTVFLLAGQTDPKENGPWVWQGAGVNMSRASNWDTNAEAVAGSFWVVEEGTSADKFAMVTTDIDVITGAMGIGTRNLAFTTYGGVPANALGYVEGILPATTGGASATISIPSLGSLTGVTLYDNQGYIVDMAYRVGFGAFIITPDSSVLANTINYRAMGQMI